MRPHVEPPPAHQLYSRFHRHIPCTPLNSSSFPRFDLFCLNDSVFIRIHPCFPVKVLSMIVLIRFRHSSLCGSVAFPCDASDAHPGQPPVCPFLCSTSGALSTTILSNGGPAPSLSAVTFFVNLNSGATICHGVPHKPSQSVDSQAPLSVRLGQLLPRTTPFLVIHKTAPVRS